MTLVWIYVPLLFLFTCRTSPLKQNRSKYWDLVCISRRGYCGVGVFLLGVKLPSGRKS